MPPTTPAPGDASQPRKRTSTAAKKTAAKKAPARKIATRKAPPKKVAAKKTGVGKAPARKAAARKAPTKKVGARKAPPKKGAATRAPTREALATEASPSPFGAGSPRERIRAAAAAISAAPPSAAPPSAATSAPPPSTRSPSGYQPPPPPPSQPAAAATPPPPPWTPAETRATTGDAPPEAPPAKKRFPVGLLIAVLAVVAVVAAALVLIFVVHVFEGSSRPSVKDPVEKLVLTESQVPSGYTLQGHECGNTEGVTGFKSCFASNYRRKAGDETKRLVSVAASFVDPASASNYFREAKDLFEKTASCKNANGQPVPRSELTLVDLPSSGLGDESLGRQLRCPGLASAIGEYVWRVDNVVQVVAGPESARTLRDLARKVEARK